MSITPESDSRISRAMPAGRQQDEQRSVALIFGLSPTACQSIHYRRSVADTCALLLGLLLIIITSNMIEGYLVPIS
jgi:hypothetical protein